MIVILPCSVNFEFSFHELVAETGRHLKMEDDHRIAEHDGVEGTFACHGHPHKFSAHWMLFMPDQAEG